MIKYIEKASDKNVRGVELYVTDDGYLYLDSEFNTKIDKVALGHILCMNNLVIVDNGVYYKPTSYTIGDHVEVVYLTVVAGDPETVGIKKVYSAEYVAE